MSKIEIQYKDIKELIPYVNNARTHSQEQINQVASSIKEFGFTNPVLIDEQGGIIAGHGRIMASKTLNIKSIPTITLSNLSEAQKKAYIIADNKLALNAGWDEELLKLELEELLDLDFNLDLAGFNLEELSELGIGQDEKELYPDGVKGSMNTNFGVPPFSVFDAKNGNWKDRKKYWTDIGFKSSDGRQLDNTNASETINKGSNEGGSIFDPVLCEIGYKWFCPKGGNIFDPFAGGSVRGLMASFLDRHYVGIDLRQEQIDANNEQLHLIEDSNAPTWICGDSLNAKELVREDFKADLVFSCPPYADLEVYSDNPKDLSNMDYNNFIDIYSLIIQNCYDILKDDSFAFWVVGEVRDKKGNYYNFVGDTIQSFIDAGFSYYNEVIYLTPLGSLPLRAGKVIKASRKIGKAHQNVLIFLKGDAKKATANCGEIEMDLIEEVEE